MSVTIPPALTRRHAQSATVSELMLTLFANMRWVYQRKKNLNAVCEEMLVACAVRQNDAAGGTPLSVSGIAKTLNVPRSNIQRSTEALVKAGLIKRDGAGFVGDLDYLARHMNSDYFLAMKAAILKAADELRASDAAP